MKKVTKKEIIKALKKVIDPEVGISIVDLGLIYDVKVEEKKILIKMTLTTPFCPLGRFLLSSVEQAVKKFGRDVRVELVFDPPWTPEKMSKKAKKALGFNLK